MNFQEFLVWSKLREPLMQEGEKWYIQQAYDFAVKYQSFASPYLDSVKREYVYNLTLHLIILTPLLENSLYKKYFLQNPNANATEAQMRLKNFASYASSVSDSTSSVSSLAFQGLNEMSVGDAMLILTPYGAFVKSLNDSLKHSIIVG